jgi:hypothetical protein
LDSDSQAFTPSQYIRIICRNICIRAGSKMRMVQTKNKQQSTLKTCQGQCILQVMKRQLKLCFPLIQMVKF